jgi:tRNA nucleotidyltransferase/poly(A) polymerase
MTEPHKKLKLDIPLDADLLDLAAKWPQKSPLFVVGGAVRDHVFSHFHGGNANPKDFDLASGLTADEVKSILQQHRIHFTEQGAAFGIIVARINGKEFEIASFREEWYDPELGDGRRPDEVKQGSTPGKDASRRDLTINALFYDIRSREVQDYLDGDGLEDIKNKMVRPAGDPRQRFQEDKLRVLRLIRFFCRYNDSRIQHHLDESTNFALYEFGHLTGVSAERKLAEFLAGLKQAICPQKYLEALNHFGLLQSIFPGVEINRLAVLNTRNCRNPKAILANLFRDNNPGLFHHPKVGLGTLLKFPGWLSDGIEFLLKLQKWKFNPQEVAQMLRRRDKFLRPDMTEDERKEAKRAVWDDVASWANLSFWGGLPFDWEKAKFFLLYEPTVKAQEFIDQGLSGKELGHAIAVAEAKAYDERFLLDSRRSSGLASE